MIADVELIASAGGEERSQEFEVNWSLSRIIRIWDAQDVRKKSEGAEGPCCEKEKVRWWGGSPA